jgi:hypothetical protein
MPAAKAAGDGRQQIMHTETTLQNTARYLVGSHHRTRVKTAAAAACCCYSCCCVLLPHMLESYCSGRVLRKTWDKRWCCVRANQETQCVIDGTNGWRSPTDSSSEAAAAWQPPADAGACHYACVHSVQTIGGNPGCWVSCLPVQPPWDGKGPAVAVWSGSRAASAGCAPYPRFIRVTRNTGSRSWCWQRCCCATRRFRHS